MMERQNKKCEKERERERGFNVFLTRFQGQFHATVEWSQKYGRVFGFFEGYTPVLSISDPDILSQILGKDASNFMSRKVIASEHSKVCSKG